jgi:hypothetical protein
VIYFESHTKRCVQRDENNECSTYSTHTYYTHTHQHTHARTHTHTRIGEVKKFCGNLVRVARGCYCWFQINENESLVYIRGKVVWMSPDADRTSGSEEDVW